jgi:hypothetical protein
LKKFLKVLGFSILEALTFGLLWDVFFDKGAIVTASLLSFPLVAIEHIMARNTADDLPLFANFFKRLPLQLILGATELVFWDVWRLIHQRVEPEHFGPILGMVVFALLLIPQHNAEHNVNTGENFFKKLFRGQGVVISVIEAVTAMGWLFAEDTNGRLLALIPLVLGLTVEHVVREFGEPKGLNV